ncbi:hypothetical protein OAS39_12960 [Pirellulales bacterium]|nr:hypothetical protein [Pirellulales bacterium]
MRFLGASQVFNGVARETNRQVVGNADGTTEEAAYAEQAKCTAWAPWRDLAARVGIHKNLRSTTIAGRQAGPVDNRPLWALLGPELIV